MPKLNQSEKKEMEAIFADDFARIERTMNKQLVEAFSEVRNDIIEKVGIKKSLSQLKKLEDEIAKKKEELQQMRERMQMEISQKERELMSLRETAVGEYSGPPTAEQLKELEIFSHDSSIEGREWFGFSIRTKLDAETAIRLKSKTDVSGPIKMLEQICRAVKRELAFAGTHEAAQKAYEKFYELDFRRLGVDIAPMLTDFKAVNGKKLLSASVELDRQPKGLLGSGK